MSVIVTDIHKNYPERAKIKLALWNYSSTEPILLSILESSSLRRIWLPGYNKKTNHFVLPVSIQYVDNKQKLKDRKFVRTKFLKRQVYGYFYNNLRIIKPGKLTRKELHNFYREQRVNRANEYQKMMEEHKWSKADLARYLGVSRAWITIVMREVG